MVADRVSAELFAWPGGTLDRRRLTRCALARVCGACEATLARPIVFLGTTEEVARNEFHAPPLHAACAPQVQAVLGPLEAVRASGSSSSAPPVTTATPLRGSCRTRC